MGDNQIPENLFGEHRSLSCYDGEATREHAGQIVVGLVERRPGDAALCVVDTIADTVAWVVMESATARELFVDYCLLATSDNGGQSVIAVWGWGKVTLSRGSGSTGMDVEVQSDGHPDTRVVVDGAQMHHLWYDLGWLANEVAS